MSLQLAIALVHVPLSKFGQVPGQPIDAGETSPAVPHVLSSPPHALATPPPSLVVALSIFAAAVASVLQTVACGSLPATFASSHCCSAFIFACANLEEALAIPCSHLTGLGGGSVVVVVGGAQAPKLPIALALLVGVGHARAKVFAPGPSAVRVRL